MQFNLHWIVYMIEISAFINRVAQCRIWTPRRLSGYISSASIGNLTNLITLVDMAEKKYSNF
jgi:hypothetical protein